MQGEISGFSPGGFTAYYLQSSGGSGGLQRMLSPDQNPMFQGDLYPHCAKDLPPGHDSFLGVCGPSESPVLPTESWA